MARGAGGECLRPCWLGPPSLLVATTAFMPILWCLTPTPSMVVMLVASSIAPIVLGGLRKGVSTVVGGWGCGIGPLWGVRGVPSRLEAVRGQGRGEGRLVWGSILMVLAALQCSCTLRGGWDGARDRVSVMGLEPCYQGIHR